MWWREEKFFQAEVNCSCAGQGFCKEWLINVIRSAEMGQTSN